MQSFELLSQKFALHFEQPHFPNDPASLYKPNEYFLQLGGKRIRPVLCLMGNELFDEINPDAWHVATAIELFHNFTLIHDDIIVSKFQGLKVLSVDYYVTTTIKKKGGVNVSLLK